MGISLGGKKRIKKEGKQSGLLIRKLASPCRDRRPRLSVREKIDTQKAKINPDRFSRSVGVVVMLDHMWCNPISKCSFVTDETSLICFRKILFSQTDYKYSSS